MKHIDARQILDNRFFNELVAQRKETALNNFTSADIDNDRARLVSQVQIQLLRDIVDELEEACKLHTE